jgi:hypothetical protein
MDLMILKVILVVVMIVLTLIAGAFPVRVSKKIGFFKIF